MIEIAKIFYELRIQVLILLVWTTIGATAIRHLRYKHGSQPIYRSDIAAYVFLGLVFGPLPLAAVAIDFIDIQDSCVLRCYETK